MSLENKPTTYLSMMYLRFTWLKFSLFEVSQKISESSKFAKTSLIMLYNNTLPILCSILFGLLFHVFSYLHHHLKSFAFQGVFSNAEPQLLQPNLHPVVTAKKKKPTCTLEVKDAVYKAVKRDGMSLSLAHIASVFGISGGKSAVQKIVLGGPYDQLVGFQRCKPTSCISWRLQ